MGRESPPPLARPPAAAEPDAAAGEHNATPQTPVGTPSIVLTHHWLVRRRGGERVLEAFCELAPDAPLFTLVHDPHGLRASFPAAPASCAGPSAGDDSACSVAEARRRLALIERRDIRASVLQRVPGARRHYPKLLPLMPAAARLMKLPEADVVLCSDAALAKAMTPHRSSRVICYCHSPMRYVWDLCDEYGRSLPRVLRPFWPRVARRLRDADRRAAERVDQFVANSSHVADRIRRHYGRDSVVIHPPVDLPPAPVSDAAAAGAGRAAFYLCVGHHVAYKRLDLAVSACGRLGRELVVIGTGPQAELLRRQRGNDQRLRFLGWQPDEVIADHYRRSRGLLFPGEEDFGIVPVEALAHGCPVIAYGVGGARETVVDGTTGVLFEPQTVEALVAAMERAEALTWTRAAMRAHAERFSRERFLAQMRAVLTGGAT